MQERKCYRFMASQDINVKCDSLKQETRREPQLSHMETMRALDRKEPDGGPSSYYDYPEHFKTHNDWMEWKAKTQWKEYSLHLKDVSKVTSRWGAKLGTNLLYDARKLVYSGLRLIVMIAGKGEARKILEDCLNDPQFK